MCLVLTDEGNDNSVVFRDDVDVVLAVERRVSVDTLALQRSSQCMK